MFDSASFSFRPLAVVLATVTLTACTEWSPTSVSGSDPFQPADGWNRTTSPMDADINQHDTWVMFDAIRERTSVLSTQEPIFDPRTEQYVTEISTTAHTQTLHVEAGYDSYGTVRVNEYRQDPGLDPYLTPVDETRRIQVIGDHVTVYDASGDVISAAHIDGSEPALAELGSLAGAQVTEGVVMDQHSVDNTAAYDRKPSFSRAGPQPQAERIGSDRLRLTTVIYPDAPAAGGKATAVGQEEARLVRSYIKQGDKWVLEETEITAKGGTDKATTQTREITRLTNVRWHQNKEKDAHRRAVRERERASASSTPSLAPLSGPRLSTATCIVDEFGNPCDSGGGSGGGDGGTTTNYCTNPDPALRNVVFQHGFLSDQHTWSDMDPWMSADFYLGCKLKYSLSSLDRLPNQAQDLNGRIRNESTGNFLFIGHSNGGMISRHVAQNHPDLVNGAITIGSPHQGAPLAKTTSAALGAALSAMAAWGWAWCPKDTGLVCGRVAFYAGTIVPLLVKYGVEPNIAAFNDMRPGSDFHNALNGTQETFPRVGIQSYSKRLFVEYRLAGDMWDGPDGTKGGKNMVRGAKVALGANTACGVVGILIGNTTQAVKCANRAAFMVAVTGFWNVTVSGLDRSDGIVPGKSQVYPNANRNYGITDGDSHVGETRSGKVRQQLRNALRYDMQVTPRPGW